MLTNLIPVNKTKSIHAFRNEYIVFLLFLILFSCNEEKNRFPIEHKDFCSNIHIADSLKLSRELAPFQQMMSQKTGVITLEDGNKSMVARAWLTEAAEKSIDIQYFIFSTDNVGLIACDYLVRAADRGVKVRILVDDLMVDASLTEILAFASHPNIDVKIYNPGVNLGKNLFQKIKKFATDFRTANERMHNKTFIVDDQVVITGGRNIADEYFDFDHEYNFRDRDVLLMGQEVSRVKSSFTEFWDCPLSIPIYDLDKNISLPPYDKENYYSLHQYACNPDNFWPQVREEIQNLASHFESIKDSGDLVWTSDVQFVSDIPGKNDQWKGLGGGGITTDSLISLIKNAKSSIDIQTPYLITTDLSQQLFEEAVDRGVKVRILTNSLASTDNVEAFASYQSSRNELLSTGIQIFEFRPDAQIRKKIMSGALQREINHTPTFGLHAKSMVVDNHITVIGTFNLDPRSANLNTECITIIRSDRIAQDVLHGMNEEFKPENSWQITKSFNPDQEVSRKKRIKTWTRKILPKGIL